MIVPIPYVHIGLGTAILLVSIPLIMRKIPMNHGFGIRVSQAFVSEHNWYELNAFGGKLLSLFGAFLVGFGYLTKDVAPPATSLWAPVFFILPLPAIIPVLVLTKAFARHLPDG